MASSAFSARAAHLLGRIRRARLWLLAVFGGVAVALFPWTAYLSATLPSEHVTHHWQVAWTGFDLFEAAALAATFVAVLKRSLFVAVLAPIAGTALLCDAWFDLVTAQPGREREWALLFALAGELPLAALCFWIAFEAGEAAGAIAGAEAASAADPRPTARPGRHAGGREGARTSGSAAPSAERTSR